MRGAGPNFGIVTSFEFRLHDLEGTETHGSVLHPVERLDEVASVFRELAEDGPDELTASLGVGWAIPEQDYPSEVAGRPTVMLTVLHSGSAADADRDLRHLHALGPPVLDTIAPKPYVVTQGLTTKPWSGAIGST
jgi:hypothetical protein